MYKFFLSICLCSLISWEATAQNINSKKAKVKYTIPPFFKKTFTTYSIDVVFEGIDLKRYSIQPNDIESIRMTIGSELGLKNVPKDADFRIHLLVGCSKNGSAIMNEQYMRKSVMGQSDQSFYVRFQLDMPVKLEVTDKDGNMLLQETLDNYTRQESDLIATNLEEKAKQEFIKMWYPTLYSRSKTQLFNHAQSIRKKLNRKMHGESATSEGWFQAFKKADKYNLQAYNEWADKAIETLKNIAGEGDIDKIKTSLEGPIQFWLTQYDSAGNHTDELSIKKKFACAYNLAHAYSWTGDMENTRKYLDACIAINLPGAGGAINYLDQNIKSRN